MADKKDAKLTEALARINQLARMMGFTKAATPTSLVSLRSPIQMMTGGGAMPAQPLVQPLPMPPRNPDFIGPTVKEEPGVSKAEFEKFVAGEPDRVDPEAYSKYLSSLDLNKDFTPEKYEKMDMERAQKDREQSQKSKESPLGRALKQRRNRDKAY